MGKTALNTQLATIQLKLSFITSNLLTAEDQMCGKVLVASEKNKQLDLDSSSGVMFFFGHTVFSSFQTSASLGQKKRRAGWAQVRSVRVQGRFNFAGRRERTKHFHPRMTLKQPLPYRAAFEVCA